MIDAKSLYNKLYSEKKYAFFHRPDEHFAFQELQSFITGFDLKNKRCLEIGSGRGLFQDLVDNYTGLDISTTLAAYYHKPFYSGMAESLPFETVDHTPEREHWNPLRGGRVRGQAGSGAADPCGPPALRNGVGALIGYQKNFG